MALCGAKTRSGQPCRTKAMPNGRCRMHGGESLSGIAHPNFVHGGRSKHLPARMQADYAAALQDPNLLSLKHYIAIADARLEDLLRRADTGESATLWKEIRETFKSFKRAAKLKDTVTQAEALSDLDELITRGYTDSALWVEIGDLMQQRRKLGESETKRLIALRQMMTADQVMTFLAQVEHSVKRHVHDPVALKAIAEDIGRLLA